MGERKEDQGSDRCAEGHVPGAPSAPTAGIETIFQEHVEAMKNEVIPAIEEDLRKQALAANALRRGDDPK